MHIVHQPIRVCARLYDDDDHFGETCQTMHQSRWAHTDDAIYQALSAGLQCVLHCACQRHIVAIRDSFNSDIRAHPEKGDNATHLNTQHPAAAAAAHQRQYLYIPDYLLLSCLFAWMKSTLTTTVQSARCVVIRLRRCICLQRLGDHVTSDWFWWIVAEMCGMVLWCCVIFKQTYLISFFISFMYFCKLSSE